MDKNALLKVYGELQAINDGAASLGQHDIPAERSVQRFNQILTELVQSTGDQSFNSYTVPLNRVGSSGRSIARRSDFKQNVYTATRLLHENHLKDYTTPPKQQSPPDGFQGSGINQTFQQHQSNEQTTEVSVEFNQTIISLTEILTQREAELEEGTPERGFIKKLKFTLAGAKNTIEVIRLVMVLAAEFGLTIEQVKDLLS